MKGPKKKLLQNLMGEGHCHMQGCTRVLCEVLYILRTLLPYGITQCEGQGLGFQMDGALVGAGSHNQSGCEGMGFIRVCVEHEGQTKQDIMQRTFVS
jgi:hypothetical protein